MATATARRACDPLQTSRIPHLLYAITSKPFARPPQHQHLRTHTRLLRPRNSLCPHLPSTIRHSSTALPSSQLRARQTTTRNPRSPTADRPFAQGRKLSTFVSISGAFGFALALYISYVYTTYSRALVDFHLSHKHLAQDADVSSRYDDVGRDFDDEVELSEKLMFMGRKRMRMCRSAAGKVLEVSCGTGRNAEFYDLSPGGEGEGEGAGVESITFNDQSREMIEVARGKWDRMMGKSRNWKERAWVTKEGKVHWIVGDASVRGSIRRPDGGYDTVVQTMGICSVQNAVAALKMLGTLVRQPGEGSEGQRIKEKGGEDRGGRILLLEHGKGYYDWTNRWLDAGAEMHADHYGCWWNKDIGKVVRESGLKVESIRRYHLGTTWEIVLRPNPGADDKKG